MPKYKIYPKGYDAYKAAGPPTDFDKSIGLDWSEEETKKMKEMEKKAFLSNEKPKAGIWFIEIE